MNLIDNVQIYGLENSIRVSKFPMAINPNTPTTEITDTTIKLGSVPTGTGHDNFLKGIIVQFDLTFTIKAWTEAERYHFFEFVSSMSTMHKITKFNLDNAYNEYVDKKVIEIMKKLVKEYNEIDDKNSEEAKNQYLKCLYTNPTGMFLTAGMTTNYQQLKTIYQQRKNHRLPEWREFCKWCETLPHFMDLCFPYNNKIYRVK